MTVKRVYTRQQLTRTAPAGPCEWQCMLCDRMGHGVDIIVHEASCVLADDAVDEVVVAAKSWWHRRVVT